MANLDAAQLDRYARQIVLGEVGPEGQQALLDGSVLVVGAGGLGAPVIQYLAAAGVGTLGIVDGDVVERSNLQRQGIHGDADVGRVGVRGFATLGCGVGRPDDCVEIEQRLGHLHAPVERSKRLIEETDGDFRTVSERPVSLL